MREFKSQLVAAAVGVLVGVLGTYALVWRDVAVIRAEISHINEDINEIQEFIANDDPQAWQKAKRAIKAEQGKHATQ